ncbi:MAG: hypothetical protein AB1726_00115 [Planctomycetota bacterium]
MDRGASRIILLAFLLVSAVAPALAGPAIHAQEIVIARAGARRLLATRALEVLAAGIPFAAFFRGTLEELGEDRVRLTYRFADPAELEDFLRPPELAAAMARYIARADARNPRWRGPARPARAPTSSEVGPATTDLLPSRFVATREESRRW